MQLCNTVFGSGMTSKLFVNVREKLSLCYSVGSAYYGGKGIIAVAAGIDGENQETTKAEILRQLEDCQKGQITAQELEAARQTLLSSLRSIHDSPGAIEGYYATAALSGMAMDPETYMEKIRCVTTEDVVAAANTVKLHTQYVLKGG
jgi:predicted Zn-dependent peptidase